MILPLAAWLLACRDPAPRPGTFVGNPELVARLAQPPPTGDSPTDPGAVEVIDGLLAAPEVLLGDCDQVGDVPLGERILSFDGPLSDDVLQIPTGTHCGVYFVVDGFTIRLDEGDGEEPTTVIADDFDLWIDTRFEAENDTRHTLRFGDEQWLADVALAAGPGENLVTEESPALYEAFFGGLRQGSAIDEAEAPLTTLPQGEPTRVDLERWPVGGDGTPTSTGGCGVGTTHPLAVPIPPAAMLGAGWSDEVGWCVADLTVADSLEYQLTLQTDFRDGSDYEIRYNAWSQGCGTLHCGDLQDAAGQSLNWPCTAMALCDGATGTITVTGFEW